MELALDPRQVPPYLVAQETFFRAQFALLSANYLRLAEPAATAGAELLYRRAIARAAWLTPALLDTTVEWVIEHVDGPLPTVAAFLDYARERADDQRRQAATAAAQPALPGPVLESGASRFDRAAFTREVATARLVQRRRQAAIAAWRRVQRTADPAFPQYGPVPREVGRALPLPAPAEIEALVAEMATQRAHRAAAGRRTALDRAAAQVLDALSMDGRVPPAA